jgi:hypothetical protein
MSRPTPGSHSPPKNHSQGREAAVLAIIDSLHGSDSTDTATPVQAMDPNLPDIGPDPSAGSGKPATTSGPTRALSDASPEPPPPPPPVSIAAEPTILTAQSDVPADESPPPPPPPSARADATVELQADEPPPPPPPTPAARAEPALEPPPKPKADYASSSAMVKDILSADPQKDSDETAETSQRPEEDSESADRPSQAPLSSDFFTSARQKKRRWRIK